MSRRIPMMSFMLFILLGFQYQPCSASAPSYFQFYDDLEKEPSLNDHLVIHMMFFPWDSNQQFMEDEFKFDHSPYQRMLERVKSIPNAHVIMWTHSKTKEFCAKYYPAIWDTIEKFSQRNVMYIDILRCLVVHHYGGIYWQYDCIPYCSSMLEYLPSKDKKLRLFTETIISQEFSKRMALEPIRKGRPEEIVRVATQVFSANERKNSILIDHVAFQLQRMLTDKLICDYDLLYITANAAMSEYYDRFAKCDKDVELVSLELAQKMVNWNAKGRWRMDWKK